MMLVIIGGRLRRAPLVLEDDSSIMHHAGSFILAMRSWSDRHLDGPPPSCDMDIATKSLPATEFISYSSYTYIVYGMWLRNVTPEKTENAGAEAED